MLLCLMLINLCAQTSCGIENIDKKKVRDLEYEILEEENIPLEIFEQITNEYDKFGRSAYICSDKLYIVVCYGAQPTQGYTIEINSLYESSNAIIVETTLKGPSRQEEVEEKISYPYVVLKLEKSDKMVVFN